MQFSGAWRVPPTVLYISLPVSSTECCKKLSTSLHLQAVHTHQVLKAQRFCHFVGIFQSWLERNNRKLCFCLELVKIWKVPRCLLGQGIFGGKETEVLPCWTSDALVSLISCSSVNLSFGCLRHLQRRSSPLQFWSHYDLWRETRLRNAENMCWNIGYMLVIPWFGQWYLWCF